MSKVRPLVGIVTVALMINAVACSDDNGTDDAGTQDQFVPPTKIVCDNDCKDFVFDQITVPVDAAQADKFGWVDAKGNKWNQLGTILATLPTMGLANLELQDSLDQAVNEGDTIALLRLQSADFAAGPTAKGQFWTGQGEDCCPNNKGGELEDCKTEAQGTCFGGSFTFTSTGADDQVLAGSLAGGKIDLGPGKLSLSIPLSATADAMLDMSIVGAQLRGTVQGDKIVDGVLAGVITMEDLQTGVLPSVQSLLNATLNDPAATQDSKDMIITIFDKNPTDGEISIQEINESAIATFLQGDVDGDGDGDLDLSVGIGFTGVTCTIQ